MLQFRESACRDRAGAPGRTRGHEAKRSIRSPGTRSLRGSNLAWQHRDRADVQNPSRRVATWRSRATPVASHTLLAIVRLTRRVQSQTGPERAMKMAPELRLGARRILVVSEGVATTENDRGNWPESVGGWELTVLPPRQAGWLLKASRKLKHDLDEIGGRHAPPSLGDFNRVVTDLLPAPHDDDRTLVVSQWPVPLDLAQDNDGDWGERGIYSHLLVRETLGLDVVSRSVGDSTTVPLGTYLLVCPMAMDRFVPRYLQDIVRVATELEGQIPVEMWLQPTLGRALQAFGQPHVGVLHIDTHGTATTMMLGPTRDDSRGIGASDLPDHLAIPLVIVVGCELAGSADGIGATLIRRGVRAVFGTFVTFHSLGVAGSEEGEADWYRQLYQGLIRGDDLGRAVLNARRAVGQGVLRYCWLTLGSSLLRFSPAGLPWGSAATSPENRGAVFE
jgi:hypothetical protein